MKGPLVPFEALVAILRSISRPGVLFEGFETLVLHWLQCLRQIVQPQGVKGVDLKEIFDFGV